MVRLGAAIAILFIHWATYAQLAFSLSDPNVVAWAAQVVAQAGTPDTPPIGFTYYSKTNDTTARSSYVTAPAYQPNSNSLVIAVVVNSKASAPDTPTFSGNGLTWVQVGTTNFNTLASPTQRLTVFRATGTAPTSTGGTASFGANQTGCNIGVCEFTNVCMSSTNGAGALAQVLFNATNTVTNPNITLSAFNSNGKNSGLILSGNAANGYGGTPEANWTEDLDTGYNTPATGCYIAHTNLSRDNTLAITQGSSISWGICGMEIKSLTNAEPGIITQPVNQSVSSNSSATFTVYALGRLNLSYQWYQDSSAGTAVSGATSSSYTKSNCQLTDSGTNYVCVITNVYGAVTSSVASLTVTGSGPSGSPKYASVKAIATASSTYSALGTNITVSGANTLMIAGIAFYTTGSAISSMKMDGNSTSMTLITNTSLYDTGGSIYLYGGYAPVAGSNYVQANMTGNPDQGTLAIYLVTNSPQANAFITPVAKFTASNVPGYTNTVTSVNGGLCIDLFGNPDPGGTYSVGQAGQVEIAQANCGSTNSGLGISFTNSTGTSTTMSWISSSGDKPFSLITVGITNSP